MKKNHITKEQIVLLLLFLAAIALPGALLFHNTGGLLTDDNRMAAQFPKLIKDDGGFATRTELENFLKDNVGFRSLAPQINMMFMYDVFGIISDPTQLQGKDGALFVGDNKRYPTRRAPHAPLTDAELAENGKNITAASDYFKTKDIPFLFITIPDKEEVYSDLYPDTFVKRPTAGRLAQQSAWLLANTDVDAYDMTEILREKAAQTDETLWYETADSAHWNAMGAFVGYEEIMARLKQYDPSLETLSIDDFDVTETREPYQNKGKTFTFDGLYNTIYKFDYKPGFKAVQIDYTNDPWMPVPQLNEAGFQAGGVYFHYHNEDKDGQLVFFGDSYVYQFLLPYFAESFGDVYLFHLPTNYQIMKPILDMIGADFVVLEMVERTYGITNMDTMAAEFAADAPTLQRPEDYPDVD